jgi:hypothetical protein
VSARLHSPILLVYALRVTRCCSLLICPSPSLRPPAVAHCAASVHNPLEYVGRLLKEPTSLDGSRPPQLDVSEPPDTGDSPVSSGAPPPTSPVPPPCATRHYATVHCFPTCLPRLPACGCSTVLRGNPTPRQGGHPRHGGAHQDGIGAVAPQQGGAAETDQALALVRHHLPRWAPPHVPRGQAGGAARWPRPCLQAGRTPAGGRDAAHPGEPRKLGGRLACALLPRLAVADGCLRQPAYRGGAGKRRGAVPLQSAAAVRAAAAV